MVVMPCNNVDVFRPLFEEQKISLKWEGKIKVKTKKRNHSSVHIYFWIWVGNTILEIMKNILLPLLSNFRMNYKLKNLRFVMIFLCLLFSFFVVVLWLKTGYWLAISFWISIIPSSYKIAVISHEITWKHDQNDCIHFNTL
jgi:hypothetical protein